MMRKRKRKRIMKITEMNMTTKKYGKGRGNIMDIRGGEG